MGSSFIASELSCAVLSAQLNQSLSITAQRVQNFYYYQQMLIPLEEQGLLQLPCIPEYCETNGHIFFILLPTSSIRMAVEKHFMERKISVFSHYLPLHSSPAGLKYGRVASGTELSITTSISSRLLRLPVWIDMTEEQLNSVVDSLKGILIFNK